MSADCAESSRINWSGKPVNQSVASFMAHEEQAYSGLLDSLDGGLGESMDSLTSADSLDLRAADKQSIEAFFKPENFSSKKTSSVSSSGSSKVGGLVSNIVVMPPSQQLLGIGANGDKLHAFESTIVTMINNNNRSNVNVNQNMRIRVSPKSSSGSAAPPFGHQGRVVVYNAVKINNDDPLRLISFKENDSNVNNANMSHNRRNDSNNYDNNDDDDAGVFVYKAAIKHPNDVVKVRPFREQMGFAQLQQQRGGGSNRASPVAGFNTLPALPGLVAPSSSGKKQDVSASSVLDDARNISNGSIYDDDEESYGPVGDDFGAEKTPNGSARAGNDEIVFAKKLTGANISSKGFGLAPAEHVRHLYMHPHILSIRFSIFLLILHNFDL